MNDTFKKEIMDLLDECSLKEIILKKEIDFKTLCDWKKEKDMSRLIKSYIQNNQFDKAIAIGNQFLDNEVIQSQMITILIKQKMYDEAFKIGKRFPDCDLIQGQIITILMKQKRYDQAYEIGKRFPNNEIIQGQMVFLLFKKERYDLVLDIGKNFPYNRIIQSQTIKILIRNEKYDEVLEIGKRFPDNVLIQSQMITALIKQTRYDEAYEIGKRFLYNDVIQSQIIDILIKEERYDEALVIGKGFLNNVVIRKQMLFIKRKKKHKKGKIKYQIINTTIDCYELNVIRSKILLNTISQDDIKLLDKVKDKIDDNTYKFVLAAIYERLSLKNKAINILNSIDNFDRKKINQLIGIIKNKKNKYYSVEKWDSIIGWPVDKEIDINSEDSCFIQNNETLKQTNAVPVHFEDIDQNTIYDSLNDKYKKMVFQLKLQYYREMYNINARKEATNKYDRLEDILYQKASNQKAFLKLLLILIESGFKNEIKRDYNEEFNILTDKIQQIKMLTKKG